MQFVKLAPTRSGLSTQSTIDATTDEGVRSDCSQDGLRVQDACKKSVQKKACKKKRAKSDRVQKKVCKKVIVCKRKRAKKGRVQKKACKKRSCAKKRVQKLIVWFENLDTKKNTLLI